MGKAAAWQGFGQPAAGAARPSGPGHPRFRKNAACHSLKPDLTAPHNTAALGYRWDKDRSMTVVAARPTFQAAIDGALAR